MYTGYQFTRLTNIYGGDIHVGRRLEFNGTPIHHLHLTQEVQRKFTKANTPDEFDCNPISKWDLRSALARKKRQVKDICADLDCSINAIYCALRQPNRYKRIATHLRHIIAEAK